MVGVKKEGVEYFCHAWPVGYFVVAVMILQVRWRGRRMVGGAACMDSVLCTLTHCLSTWFPKMCSVQEEGETQLPRKKSQ